MKDGNVVIVTLAVTALFGSAMIISQLYVSSRLPNEEGSYYPNGKLWMGGSAMMGGMVNMMATQGQTVSASQAIQTMRNISQYASVISANNTVIFKGSNIKLVALATGREGLSNLTANTAPDYATDDIFVIYGLVNPTVVIPHSAKLEIVIFNLDGDMYHNFVITASSPPYLYMAMQGMMMNRYQGIQGIWTMMPFLSPANSNQGMAHEYSYSVTLPDSGSLWYLCAYPGHARDGMYGKMLIV